LGCNGDHLGNVRLSYTDNNNSGKIEAASEIIEESNYYPFGLKHKGYNNNVTSLGNSTAQKFGYNGTELNESLGLNLMEMDFRLYDPAIGCFNGIDPITHYSQGTSVAFDNNPIFWADPSGADSVETNDGWTFTGQGAKDVFISLRNSSSGNSEGSSGGNNSSDNSDCPDCVTFEDYAKYWWNSLTKEKVKKDLKDTGTGIAKGLIQTFKDVGESSGFSSSINITEVKDSEKFGYFAGIVLFALLEPGPGGELKAVKSLAKVDSKILKFSRETFESNKALRKSANNLIEQLTIGNINPGIGTKKVFGNVFEARARDGARVYFREAKSTIEILGYSNKSNQQAVINQLKKLYN